MRLPASIVLAVVALAPVGLASDWPRFRGPNGTGVSSAGALPIDLSAPESLAWSVDLPFGRSSPVVVGDRVYLTASEGARRLTLAFGRLDGKVLWRHEATASRVEERVESRNDPASPTPAADSTGVVAFFPDVGLIALDVNGRERWRVSLGPFHTSYGMASSPVLAQGLVVQACDQQAGSFLIAVDHRTGRIRWRVERPDMREGWYTPAIASVRGRQLLIVPGSARIEGLDLQTGRPVWNVRGSGAENLGVPLVDGRRVYVNVRGFPNSPFETWEGLLGKHDADGDGRISRAEVETRKNYFEGFSYADVDRNGFFSETEWNAMRDAGVGNFGLTALNLGDGSAGLAWRFEKNLPYVPAPVLYNRIVYMVKSGGIITAIDASKGTLLKQARAADALGDYFASPVAGDGKVYLASEEGKVTVLEAGPGLRVLKVNDLGDAIYATPALAYNTVLVRTRSRLLSFRAGPEAASR